MWESRLGACHIRRLSELTLFNFKICYHSEGSNEGTAALCNCHRNLYSSLEKSSDGKAEVAISYSLSCSAV